MAEFKSFLNTVGGNEGQKCNYPTRLDTYGRGCSHDCKYCYAKSLLEFRGLWNPEKPAVTDRMKIKRALKKRSHRRHFTARRHDRLLPADRKDVQSDV